MSKIYMVHFLVQFYFISLTICQPNFLFKQCNDDYGNYTTTSIYKSNLNTFLIFLSSDTNTNFGFYNFSVGQAPNTVNGIALSRGDVAVNDCRNCLKDAASKLPQVCPTQKVASGWYDNCMLRYSNRTIFGVSEDQPVVQLTNVNNVSNPYNFSQTLGNLLSNLQQKAAAGDSLRKFADGNENYNSFSKVYALVQCTPDLSWQQCYNCIGGFIALLPSFSMNKLGAQVIGPSCHIRYESNVFYNLASAPPPSTPTMAAPPISTNTTNSSVNANAIRRCTH